MNTCKAFLSVFAILLLMGLTQCKPDDPENTDLIPLNELLGNTDGLEIVLNPNGNTPLSAIATYTANQPITACVKVFGEEPVEKVFEASSSKDIPVLGLYSGIVNEVEITLTANDGTYFRDTFEIETDTLPLEIPEILFNERYNNQSEEGMTLCTMLYGTEDEQKTIGFVFDEDAEIRWYMELEGANLPMEYLQNDLLVAGTGSVLSEYDMLGERHNELNVTGYLLHHDVLELPNGNLACATSKPGTSILGPYGQVDSRMDFFVEINRNTGGLLQEWDLREVMDVDRDELMDVSDGDWLHLNAMTYQQSDDSYILSGRHQGVFKVDRNNDLIWILAPHLNWEVSGWNGIGIFNTENYLLTAVDASGTAYSEEVQNGSVSASDFDWPFGQHAVNRLANGNVLMFDNGLKRHFQEGVSYSRAVEYEIDQANMEVKQVWEYGSELGETFYSTNMGDVDVLPGGTRLITSGNIYEGGAHYARIIEVTYPDSQVVFDAMLVFDDSCEDCMIYRSERMDLYAYFE